MSTPAAQAAPDVLYTWVDAEGVTHFSQAPGQGEKVVYDGTRITPLPAPLPVPAAGATQTQTQPAGQGSQALHELRRELVEGARQMQEAKAAAAVY